MAAAPQRLITCGQTKFDGKWVPFFYEAVFHTPLVAMANILSLYGELPGGPHERGFYPEEKLITFVATKLSAVRKINIDDAKKQIAPLARQIVLNVNFRRIEVEHTIFSDLGIPLYHGWKVVPEVHVPNYPVVRLEEAAKDVSLTSSERSFISNTYLETNFTAYGDIALKGALQLERNGLCVFYWNSHFHTVLKKNDELLWLDHRGEWQKIDKREKLIGGPSLGRREFKIICGGMIDAEFSIVLENIEVQVNLLPHIDIKLYHQSLDSIVQLVESGYHFDVVAINYKNFDSSQPAKKKICEWLWRLRCTGFYGIVVAFVWSWSDGNKYQQLEENEIDTQLGVCGIRYVRAGLEESEAFIKKLVPIFEEAIWRREVVYAEQFPADIESLEFIRRVKQ